MEAKPTSNTAVVAEIVEDIMRIYRSLPPRPSVDEVEAATVVVKTVDSEEKMRIEDVNKEKKPNDAPEELFFVLQEAKRNLVLLQSQEQRKEALFLIDLDKRFHVFDELIQRTQKLVHGDTVNESQADSVFKLSTIEEESTVVDENITVKGNETKVEKEVKKEPVVKDASLRDGFITNGGHEEKLSLIKVANIIETSAKTRAGVLHLQGKLMDRIEWLPVSLGKLSDIIDLNLSENHLMALPSTICNLRSLTKLDIHSNQIINLPESFGELINLTNLDLHANLIRSLPSSFGKLSSLTTLDLSSNQLSVLPETLGDLKSLKYLNVETNNLEELPYTIGSCTSLVELRVDFNQLKAFPEAIGKLESLEILTAHYNRIVGIPTTMGSLSKLKELDVSFNELETIPESLCFATNLVKLNVGRNFADLRTLPRSIGNLEMLEELDISSNQIRILPSSFRFLSKLRVLNSDETPLEVPPREIVKLGAQAVVQYMADHFTARNPISEESEKKGFWGWLCSLC